MKNLINCLVIMLVAGTATAQTTTQNQSSSLTAEQFINQAALSGMKEVATGKIARLKAQDKNVKDFGAMMVDDHNKANTELIALAKSKSINVPKQSDITPTSLTMNNGSTMPGTNTTGNTSGTITNSTGVGTTATSSNTPQSKQATGQTSTTAGVTNATIGNDSLKVITASDVSSAIQQLDGLSGSQFDTAYTQMMVTDHKNAIALFERGATSSDPDIKAYATRHLPTLRSHEKHVQSLSAGTGNSGQQSGHEGRNKSNQ
jgi:putative membrane protein